VGCSAYIHGYDLFITIVPDEFYNGSQVATSGQWVHPTVLLSVFGVPVGLSSTRTLHPFRGKFRVGGEPFGEKSGDMIPIHHEKSQRLFAAMGILSSNHCAHSWQADA
jgi:hypothetical protein